MSTFCAAAAPTRHPPGEAQAAPGAPLPASTLAAALVTNRGGERLTHRPQACVAPFHQPRHPNSNPPNNFGLVSPKMPPGDTRRHATPFARRPRSPCAPERRTNQLLDFWTSGAQVRKSKSRCRFSHPCRQKQSRNKGSGAPRPASGGRTFGPLLWGPLGRARRSKSPKRQVSRDAPAERSASGVDALQRSLTIRSFRHRCRQAPSPRAADARISDALLRLLRRLALLAKTQKSQPIAEPFLAKNIEKHRETPSQTHGRQRRRGRLLRPLNGVPPGAHAKAKGGSVTGDP